MNFGGTLQDHSVKDNGLFTTYYFHSTYHCTTTIVGVDNGTKSMNQDGGDIHRGVQGRTWGGNRGGCGPPF